MKKGLTILAVLALASSAFADVITVTPYEGTVTDDVLPQLYYEFTRVSADAEYSTWQVNVTGDLDWTNGRLSNMADTPATPGVTGPGIPVYDPGDQPFGYWANGSFGGNGTFFGDPTGDFMSTAGSPVWPTTPGQGDISLSYFHTSTDDTDLNQVLTAQLMFPNEYTGNVYIAQYFGANKLSNEWEIGYSEAMGGHYLVPEPSALSLLVLGAFAALRRR
ncbi:MAG: PEP-CTERM sorting domain-containing protein [Phycisphaerae bacterium]|jgi:hypothetical protein